MCDKYAIEHLPSGAPPSGCSKCWPKSSALLPDSVQFRHITPDMDDDDIPSGEDLFFASDKVASLSVPVASRDAIPAALMAFEASVSVVGCLPTYAKPGKEDIPPVDTHAPSHGAHVADIKTCILGTCVVPASTLVTGAIDAEDREVAEGLGGEGVWLALTVQDSLLGQGMESEETAMDRCPTVCVTLAVRYSEDQEDAVAAEGGVGETGAEGEETEKEKEYVSAMEGGAMLTVDVQGIFSPPGFPAETSLGMAVSLPLVGEGTPASTPLLGLTHGTVSPLAPEHAMEAPPPAYDPEATLQTTLSRHIASSEAAHAPHVLFDKAIPEAHFLSLLNTPPSLSTPGSENSPGLTAAERALSSMANTKGGEAEGQAVEPLPLFPSAAEALAAAYLEGHGHPAEAGEGRASRAAAPVTKGTGQAKGAPRIHPPTCDKDIKPPRMIANHTQQVYLSDSLLDRMQASAEGGPDLALVVSVAGNPAQGGVGCVSLRDLATPGATRAAVRVPLSHSAAPVSHPPAPKEKERAGSRARSRASKKSDDPTFDPDAPFRATNSYMSLSLTLSTPLVPLPFLDDASDAPTPVTSATMHTGAVVGADRAREQALRRMGRSVRSVLGRRFCGREQARHAVQAALRPHVVSMARQGVVGPEELRTALLRGVSGAGVLEGEEKAQELQSVQREMQRCRGMLLPPFVSTLSLATASLADLLMRLQDQDGDSAETEKVTGLYASAALRRRSRGRAVAVPEQYPPSLEAAEDVCDEDCAAAAEAEAAISVVMDHLSHSPSLPLALLAVCERLCLGDTDMGIYREPGAVSSCGPRRHLPSMSVASVLASTVGEALASGGRESERAGRPDAWLGHAAHALCLCVAGRDPEAQAAWGEYDAEMQTLCGDWSPVSAGGEARTHVLRLMGLLALLELGVAQGAERLATAVLPSLSLPPSLLEAEGDDVEDVCVYLAARVCLLASQCGVPLDDMHESIVGTPAPANPYAATVYQQARELLAAGQSSDSASLCVSLMRYGARSSGGFIPSLSACDGRDGEGESLVGSVALGVSLHADPTFLLFTALSLLSCVNPATVSALVSQVSTPRSTGAPLSPLSPSSSTGKAAVLPVRPGVSLIRSLLPGGATQAERDRDEGDSMYASTNRLPMPGLPSGHKRLLLAKDAASQALALCPSLGLGWVALALVHLLLKERSAAHTCAAAATQLNPAWGVAWTVAGIISAGEGETQCGAAFISSGRALSGSLSQEWTEMGLQGVMEPLLEAVIAGN
ncbi:hypothetical protein KIPB_000849 [Kipferlia bialata]|uniref:Uncharacterized protein n=1 Tax=Kipferlia bialata TaxID=797122 RepID=A0A9K3CMX9_9EUKA|nr:hypothetical protein KIPB_000849 [Kipferlia bialata]|eukprot:g849.t1